MRGSRPHAPQAVAPREEPEILQPVQRKGARPDVPVLEEVGAADLEVHVQLRHVVLAVAEGHVVAAIGEAVALRLEIEVDALVDTEDCVVPDDQRRIAGLVGRERRQACPGLDLDRFIKPQHDLTLARPLPDAHVPEPKNNCISRRGKASWHASSRPPQDTGSRILWVISIRIKRTDLASRTPSTVRSARRRRAEVFADGPRSSHLSRQATRHRALVTHPAIPHHPPDRSGRRRLPTDGLDGRPHRAVQGQCPCRGRHCDRHVAGRDGDLRGMGETHRTPRGDRTLPAWSGSRMGHRCADRRRALHGMRAAPDAASACTESRGSTRYPT